MKKISNNLMIKNKLLFLSSLVLAVSCSSEPPPIDRNNKDENKNNGINGVWNFEKKECINADETLNQTLVLEEGQKLSLDVKESAIVISFNYGAARNNCTVTATDTIVERKENAVIVKPKAFEYSKECADQTPPSVTDEERTYNYEIKNGNLILITAQDNECNGLKAKEHFKR